MNMHSLGDIVDIGSGNFGIYDKVWRHWSLMYLPTFKDWTSKYDYFAIGTRTLDGTWVPFSKGDLYRQRGQVHSKYGQNLRQDCDFSNAGADLVGLGLSAFGAGAVKELPKAAKAAELMSRGLSVTSAGIEAIEGDTGGSLLNLLGAFPVNVVSFPAQAINLLRDACNACKWK
jgi:hypothetical protein